MALLCLILSAACCGACDFHLASTRCPPSLCSIKSAQRPPNLMSLIEYHLRARTAAPVACDAHTWAARAIVAAVLAPSLCVRRHGLLDLCSLNCVSTRNRRATTHWQRSARSERASHAGQIDSFDDGEHSGAFEDHVLRSDAEERAVCSHLVREETTVREQRVAQHMAAAIVRMSGTPS